MLVHRVSSGRIGRATPPLAKVLPRVSASVAVDNFAVFVKKVSSSGLAKGG